MTNEQHEFWHNKRVEMGNIIDSHQKGIMSDGVYHALRDMKLAECRLVIANQQDAYNAIEKGDVF